MSASTTRPRFAKVLAVLALATSMMLMGGLTSPASAATSPNYWHLSTCLSKQKAYSGSFTRITRSCYVYTAKRGPVLDAVQYRFDYTSRY